MLDIKFIRQNPDTVRQAIKAKREKDRIDEILQLDEQKRAKLKETEDLKALRNKENEKIVQAKKEGKDFQDLVKKMGEISKQSKVLDSEISEIDKQLKELLLWVPNIPLEGIPEGGEEANKEIGSWGTVEKKDFTPKPHWDLGSDLGILENERAARLSGSSFSMLVGDGARLERALMQFMLDTHRENGYVEIAPPLIVNRKTITGTGQLPKLEEDMYRIPEDQLFLIPTAEVPLASFFQGEVIPAEKLPIRIMGMTPCFRREAGAHGKDTRGLLRLHQFHKVELIHYVKPENAEEALETLLGHAQSILEKLGLPYKTLLLATGDMSFASAKTYDLEVWAPGVDRWLEVSSCSTCGDFQSRRQNTRCKEKGQKNQFVHILNLSLIHI